MDRSSDVAEKSEYFRVGGKQHTAQKEDIAAGEGLLQNFKWQDQDLLRYAVKYSMI